MLVRPEGYFPRTTHCFTVEPLILPGWHHDDYNEVSQIIAPLFHSAVVLRCLTLVGNGATGKNSLTATLLYRTLPYPTLPYPTLSCPVLVCLGLSWLVLACLGLSGPVLAPFSRGNLASKIY